MKGGTLPDRPDGTGGDPASRDGTEASAPSASEITRLTLYADAHARRVGELQATVAQLESRLAIERAVGMLAERFDLVIADASELLSSAARESRREVRTLAREITDSRGWTPDEIVVARRGAGQP